MTVLFSTHPAYLEHVSGREHPERPARLGAVIDGTKDATQALLDGKILVVVECNPKFGPAAFAAIEKYGNGEPLEPRLVNIDRVFTKENAAEYMPEAY